MGIQEVPIGQSEKPEVRATKKVLGMAERHLHSHGLSLDQLSPDQKTAVINHIKKKRACLWSFIIAIPLVIIMSAICSVFYKHVVKAQHDFWIPDQYVVESEDGSKVLKDVDENLRETMKNYGTAISLLTCALVAAMYAAISGLATAIGAFFAIKRDRQVLNAFLPSVRKIARSRISPVSQDTEV